MTSPQALLFRAFGGRPCSRFTLPSLQCRNLGEEALTAAVVAAIRHKYTGYDEMLARGIDRAIARQELAGKIERVLEAWRARPLSEFA